MHSLLCLVALLCISLAASDMLDTKNWRTTDVSITFDAFTEILDGEKGSFYIKRLKPSTGELIEEWVHDCYEVRLDSAPRAYGKEDFKFCYPSLHIAGMGKCGTSALYDFFAQHKVSITTMAGLGKEYCPHEKGLYLYFKGMAPSFDDMYRQERIVVNGCISPAKIMPIHRILAPKSVYVYIMRELPEQQWSAHNFWCSPYSDSPTGLPCGGGRWTAAGMYRSPGMYDELLKAANYPDQKLIVGVNSCSAMNIYYHHFFAILEEHLQPGQLIFIALEEMSSPHPEPAFRRLEEGIYRWLGRKVVLERENLHTINSGNSRGSGRESTNKPPEGLYAMSNNQPMLQSSKDYIMSCWNECGRISQLTGWEYNCSQTLYTTTTDVTAMPQGFLRVVTQEENTAMHDAVVPSKKGK